MGTGNMEFDNVQLDVEFSQASERDNITSRENIALSFGKLSTWFEALVPEGGSSGQILGWKSSGKAEWINSPASMDEKVKVDKFVSTTQTDYLLTGAVASMATTAGHLVVDNADGVASARMRLQKGTTDTIGQSMIMLGNNIASGTSKNMQGMILMYSSSDKYGKIVSESLTDDRTWTLPDKSGTIAMTSDIIPVNNGKLTIKGGTTSVAEFTANQSDNTDFSIVAGSNVTVSPDAGNSKITIASSDTKVTSAANHYTPATASGQDKTASASGATAAWSIDVVKGVTLNTDGKGHVTGLSVTSGKIPANPVPSGAVFTDTKVTQTAVGSTYTNYRPIVISASNSASAPPTATTTTDGTFITSSIYCQPSSGSLYATTFYGSLNGNASKTGIRWNAVSQGQKWSRLYYSETAVNVEGSNGILSISCTRGNVVVNAVFLVFVSHSGSNASHIIELASTNYSTIRCRVVSNSGGSYYFEIYDTANNIASGTSQTWHCCFVTLTDATLTTYTAFTDGSTIPSNFAAANDFTTTVGKASAAIKDISRSGTTFTATRQDGTTFTFTQQDNNTTYTVATGDSNGQIKVTPSSGTAYNVPVKGLASAAYTESSAYVSTSMLTVTKNTNVGITPSSNVFGYVSGITAAAWNFQQTDGSLLSQYYNDKWQTEIFMDYRTGQMSTRGKNNGTWQDWRIHLDSGNYTSYTVTKTGGGASGTWGISITGNASTSTKATQDGDGNTISSTYLRARSSVTTDGGATGWSQIGINQYNNAYPNGVTNKIYSYGAVVSMPSPNARFDLYYNHNSSTAGATANGLQYRTGWDNDKKAWRMLIDNVNYTEYMPYKKPIKFQFNNGITNGYWAKLFSANYSAYNILEIDIVTYHGYDGNFRSKLHIRFTNAGFVPGESSIISHQNIAPGSLRITQDDTNTFSLWIKCDGTSSRFGYEILNISDEGSVFFNGVTLTAARWSFPTTFTKSDTAPTNAVTATRYFALDNHTHSYLPLSGGTMTGTLTAKASQYGDEYGGALNMNNSNIYGVNSIYTADVSDNAAEGIHFYRDSTHVDTLWMNEGSLLFVPNRELGTSTTAANSQKVARFTANPTTAQVVITDGTTGGIKSSGYTIATSVPSGAVFTDQKVRQSATTTEDFRPILMGETHVSGSSTGLDATVTGEAYVSTKLYCQPKTGNLYVGGGIKYGNNTLSLWSGNDCAGVSQRNNYDINTWYGFSVSNACTTTGTLNKVAFSVNARNGQAWHTGNVHLYSASGDSPALVFQRGTFVDDLNDWKIYVSGGTLYFAQSTANASSETWTNKMYFHASNGNLYVGSTKVSLEGHTHSNYLGTKSDGSYYGMASPTGADNVWIRTTSQGIIPYQAGNAGSGHNYLGTSSWYFAHAYIDTVHGSLDGTAAQAIKLRSAAARTDSTVDTADTTPYQKYWVKIASCYTTENWKDLESLWAVNDVYGNRQGILKVRARVDGTAGTFGNTRTIRWIVADSDIDVNRFAIVCYNNRKPDGTAASGTATVELWWKSTAQYASFSFVLLDETRRTGKQPNDWVLYDTSTYGQAALPTTGNITYSVAATILNSTTGNAATATTAANTNVTVTDVPSTSTTTSDSWYRSYGLLFAQNPNTTQANTLRKSHNLRFYHNPNGTTDTVGVGELIVGNNTASGTAGNMRGQLCLYSSSSSYITMTPTATSSPVILTLPAVTGTVPSFTATPTTGQVVITDGTGGGIKSSGNTISATPSAAVTTNWNTASERTIVVTKGWMSYWNGAYNGTSSNLAYCNKGAFGTIVTKNTGDYVPINGKAPNGIGRDGYVAYATDGFLNTGNGTVTGALVITTPFTKTKGEVMMKFTVDIYNYKSNTSVEYKISGYVYTDGKWYNCTAYCVSSGVYSEDIIDNLTVRFGYVTDGFYKVQIGETTTNKWQYPRINIHDITVAYTRSSYTDANSGWSVEFVTSGNIPNITQTITNTAQQITPISVTSSTLDTTPGTFAFFGSGAPWAGTDWCGLQVGFQDDRFQIVASNGTLSVRQNDASGTPTTAGWTAWKTLSTTDHTHSYIPMSGSVDVTGNIEITKASGDTGFYAKRSDTGVEVWMGVGSGGTNHGIYSNKLGKWMMYGDATNVYLNGNAVNVTGTVAIAHGGTGATDRLAALKNLTNENVGTSAQYFLTITNSWKNGGYTSVAQAKTVLGMGTLASRSYVEITSITTVTANKKFTCTANTQAYKTFMVRFSYGSTYMVQWFTVTGTTASYYPIFASMSTDAEAVLSVQCSVGTSATITFTFSNGANSPVVEKVIGFDFGG